MFKIQVLVKSIQNVQTPTSYYIYLMDSDKPYPCLSVNIQNSNEILENGKDVSNIEKFLLKSSFLTFVY